MFIERPAASLFITPANRDIGVMYRGNTKNKRLNWAAMVGNGEGPNTLRGDGALLLGARFEFQNEGGFKYLATAIEHPEELEYTVGVAYQSKPRSTLVGDVKIDDGSESEDPLDKSSDEYPCVIGTSRYCTWDNRSRDNLEFFGALRGKDLPDQRDLPDGAAGARGRGRRRQRRGHRPRRLRAGGRDLRDPEVGDRRPLRSAQVQGPGRHYLRRRLGGQRFRDQAVEHRTNYYIFQNNLKLMFNYGNTTETYDDDSFFGSGKFERSVDTFLAMLAFYI